MRRAGIIFLFLAGTIFSSAQISYTPKKYFHGKKEFYVYPVRGSNLNAVPPTAFVLPDGDYIIFTDFDFKKKLFSSEQKLRDTTKVSAFVSIKNNLPNGKATFYSYEYRFMGNKEMKRPSARTEGSFENGLKEGEWKDFIEEWLSETRTYKQGLLNGWLTSYYKNGYLYKKEKYKNERLCDTVYFYSGDGNVSMTYDIYDNLNDTSKQPRENFNDFYFGSNPNYSPVGKDNTVKSFFKTYNNGKLENNIRFTNGKNPVFDTMYSLNSKLVIKEYSKSGQESKHLVENYYEDVVYPKKIARKIVRLEYYDGFEKYISKYIYREIKTGKIDSTSSVFIDYKSLDFNSWKDTVIQINNYSGISKVHLIPAIGYAWTEFSNKPPHHKPVFIDTLKKTISVLDTFFYLPSKITKVREIEFRVAEKKKSDPEAFKKHNFLLEEFPLSTQNYFSESPEHSSYILKEFCEDFSGEEKKITFLNNGKPLDGKLILTNVKKLESKGGFEIPPVFTEKISTTLQRSDFVNGKREGTMELLVKINPKHVSADLEKSFWFKPQAGDNYIIAHYKNGVLDGNLKEFSSYTMNVPADTLHPEKENTDKLFSHLSADINYKNGILHGPYKKFHYNGKTELIADMNMGKFNGPLLVFNENGTLRMTCSFKNDSLHGDFISYSQFPNKKEEGHFENNNLQGDYNVYSVSGQILFIKITADKNILRNKKVFSEEGKLLEEITFRQNSGIEFYADMAGYENFLEFRKRKFSFADEEKMFASYKAFYENGKTLCEGEIVKGNPKGKWNFYNVQGILINEVIFADTAFLSPGDYEAKKYSAAITGYFNNGKMRCKGFVREWESGYDCTTHTDKTKFGIFYTDAWTYEGVRVIKNGNGKGIISDENGIKISLGEFLNYKEEGVWKYYDPNQKLNETGKYVKGEKDGLWYNGDLENLNFEDAACFDASDKNSQRALDYSKNVIKLTTELYRNGVMMDSQTFETDLNRERDKNFRQKF